ncbi:hypothetical protein ACFXKC_50890 [Streptomyces sp. NPDC059340]|uniref:hypothetical protein n=1 Tax=Streptomyces sp. NPDC059340 TaxID=3346806 RepID=UPI003682B9F0
MDVESGRHLRHATQDVLVADACGRDADVPDPVEDGDDEGVRTDRHVVDGLLKPGGLDRRRNDVVGGVDVPGPDHAGTQDGLPFAPVPTTRILIGQLLSWRRHSGRCRTSARGDRDTAMFLHIAVRS